MLFSLSGDLINTAGKIRLKETQSFSVETALIPSAVSTVDAQGLLSLIKRVVSCWGNNYVPPSNGECSN